MVSDNGWHVVVSPYYMDQTQSKAREIDLVAEKLWPVTDALGHPKDYIAVCYPCPPNNPSPKCPERTMKVVAEQAVRSELLSADYPVTAMFSGIPWDRGTLARSVSRP